MARVPYLSPEDLPDEDQDLLARDIALNRALVNSRGGARAFWTLGYWIRRDSVISPRLREIAILQIGYLTKNAYEFSHHIPIGYESGLTEADIDDLIRVEGGEKALVLSKLDLKVLEATKQVLREGAVDGGTFTELRQELGVEVVVELTLIISFYIGVVHLLDTLEIEVEDSYLPYLERFSLY